MTQKTVTLSERGHDLEGSFNIMIGGLQWGITLNNNTRLTHRERKVRYKIPMYKEFYNKTEDVKDNINTPIV